MVRILGIETSCDETAVGIVDDGRVMRSNAVASSLELHRPYGGVIPEIACRAHVETIWDVVHQSLQEADCPLASIDAIAVTQGPGLPGALHVGVAFAKGLALSLDRPLIPVDHLAAHLYAGEMTSEALEPPYVGLVVSGGHTLLCVSHGDARYELLGETKDDAVGEAFDKVARLLGLGYPGGPIIDKLARKGRNKEIRFKCADLPGTFDFSFSGIKTAVLYFKKEHHKKNKVLLNKIAYSFQNSIINVLVKKCITLCLKKRMNCLLVGGGVAANSMLREKLINEGVKNNIQVFFPPINLCLDNAAMIAGLGYHLHKK